MSIAAAPILHEKQEEGSMLCAQHALNALIQDSLFSADQLAEIATRLDQLEADQLDPDPSARTSQNMDDSGFFSVGVLEEALKVHNLRLVRWDSEELRPMHNYPEAFAAFVFNLESHWFTIRRFADSGDLFFNLNSFLARPERVSKLYLGMQIHQAQQEGYNVFAVVPEDMDGSLPMSDADRYFLKHPELAFAGHAPIASSSRYGNGNTLGGPSASTSSSSVSTKPRARPADFDEDMDVEPLAQRRRLSDDEDDQMRGATNGMRDAAINDYDEEEAFRKAMEESLKDMEQSTPVPPPATAAAPQPQWKPKDPPAKPTSNGGASMAGQTHASGPSSLATASKAATSTAAADDADEDDSPSPEELRRRRLARFG